MVAIDFPLFPVYKIFVVGRAGFEPATFRLSVERSSRAELPAPSRETPRLISGWLIRIFVTRFLRWVRSLARIKVSAFGAGDRGFKSHRTRIQLFPNF